ncbi:C-type lectin domain family 3 member A-like isoform X2 [Biomphalaria pfeifferi]|uniref:C-type lectin domain family 3 member A-like isoform X2 n=1 Tax=Biomphalaria pfeifferi TaxID=112525 RepID=A0AAD8EWC8_BIOPF|nr:C-type lectin domain family 3 member A-like isoform X2 [Biomphalaria pfeifferi]
MTQEKYFVTLYVLLLTHKITGQDLTLEPNPIEPGITETLVVNCSLILSNTSELEEINYIFLYHLYKDLKDLASINANDNIVHGKESNGLFSGNINRKGFSYLSMKFVLPLAESSGTYKCEVHGKDKSNSSRVLRVSTKVDSIPMTIDSAYRQIREQKQLIRNLTEETSLLQVENKELQENVINLIHFKDNVEQVNKKSLKLLFYESDLFIQINYPKPKSRRYYLSKQTLSVRSKEAQQTCYQYGGYLAEIDNSEELEFVKSFIKDRDYKAVYISGTDEEKKSQWRNSRTGEIMDNIYWHKGEPTLKDGHHCIVYWRAHGYNIGDLQCIRIGSVGEGFGFVCEMEVD